MFNKILMAYMNNYSVNHMQITNGNIHIRQLKIISYSHDIYVNQYTSKAPLHIMSVFPNEKKYCKVITRTNSLYGKNWVTLD